MAELIVLVKRVGKFYFKDTKRAVTTSATAMV